MPEEPVYGFDVATNSTAPINYVIQGNGGSVSWIMQKKDKGINPSLYFTYVKKNLNLIEKVKLDKKVKEIEAAFDKAVENGQDVLAEKFTRVLHVTVREAELQVKGITKYVEKEILNKYKNSLRDGHISDTLLKDFTRVIPKDVIAKKKKVEHLFDNFVIYHYFNESQKDLKKLSSEEKQKMRDPILFGMFKGSDRLYFIADWEDEFCDFTFDEMTKVLGKSSIGKIDKPKL